MPQPSQQRGSTQGGSRQQRAGQPPKTGSRQQGQQRPDEGWLGPKGDPAEGRPDVGPPPK
jgi:hypothetical protein